MGPWLDTRGTVEHEKGRCCQVVRTVGVGPGGRWLGTVSSCGPGGPHGAVRDKLSIISRTS